MTRHNNPRRALVTTFVDSHAGKERVSVSELADGLLDWLRVLAEQGDVIAVAALEEIPRDGAQAWIRQELRKQHYWADADTGRVLGAPSRAGVMTRDDTGVPTGHYQQAWFASLTRDELAEWRQKQAAQRDTLSIKVATADRVLRAWEDHPEAETAGDVCALAGIDLPDEMTA